MDARASFSGGEALAAEGLPIYMLILFILVLVGGLVRSPITLAWRILRRAAIGLVSLVIFNALAGLFGFFLPLNPYTIVFCGFLGLPGLITLCYLKTWI